MVDHATVPIENDAVTDDLLRCIRVDGLKVRVDVSNAVDTCKRHGIISDACSSLAPRARSAGVRVTASKAPSAPTVNVDSANEGGQVQHNGVVHDNDDMPNPDALAPQQGINTVPPQLSSRPPRVRQPRGRASWAHLSDAEKFKGSLRKLDHFYDYLKTERPQLHIRIANTPFAGHESILLSASVSRGDATERYVGVSYQITHSPPKFVTITFSLSA